MYQLFIVYIIVSYIIVIISVYKHSDIVSKRIQETGLEETHTLVYLFCIILSPIIVLISLGSYIIKTIKKL